jgi:hypothetical protein
MIRYLTGVRHPELDAMAVNEGEYGVLPPLGVLVQPYTIRYLDDSIKYYDYCGVDNGCFTPAGRAVFTLARYERLVRRAVSIYDTHMLFATAPDVPFDWAGTLRESLPVLDTIRRWGAPAALVWQDGATPENVPWDRFDVGFIGGSTEWKLGPAARELTREAKRRRKSVHMGRVNSTARLLAAQGFGCDTADGTYLKHELAKGVEPWRAAADVVDWLGTCFAAENRAAVADLRARGMDDERVRQCRLAGWVW